MALGTPPAARVRLARSIALLADFFQVLAFPLFFQGGFSPLTDVLDIGVAILMTLLLGWHWAFLPTMVTELVPVLDLFPTWTIAVFFVTRGQAKDPEPEPPPPATPRIKDITPGPEQAGAGGAAPQPSRVPSEPESR
jgi:hypothetical protein